MRAAATASSARIAERSTARSVSEAPPTRELKRDSCREVDLADCTNSSRLEETSSLVSWGQHSVYAEEWKEEIGETEGALGRIPVGEFGVLHESV